MKFANTVWDASEWIDEQKTQWQKKVFELGYGWSREHREVRYIDEDFFYLWDDAAITWGVGKNEVPGFTEKQFSDMFPEEVPVQPTIDVIQEIVDMVEARKGEVVESEEDERGFDGLVYVAPEFECSILTRKLSQEQKIFLDENLKWHDNDRPSSCKIYNSLHYCPVDENWAMCDRKTGKRVSFNSIFKYKEDL